MRRSVCLILVAAASLWSLGSEAVAQGMGIESPSRWRGEECLVADPTGTPLNVRQGPKGQILSTLRNGEGVVLGSPDESNRAWTTVFQVRGEQLAQLGTVWRKFIDCDGERQPRKTYPVFFRDPSQLVEIGVAWFDVRRTQAFASRQAGFKECPYQGEAHTISLSQDIIASHKERGFSLAKLCLMLATGSVRYDPDTGERLPTYLFAGWPDYGFFSEEFLLKVPSCFKSGAISGMGTYWHKFTPSGCQLNYHPWTGRRLSPTEAKVYAANLIISAGGEAGGSPSPESQIRENKLPVASNTSLGDLKKSLTEK